MPPQVVRLPDGQNFTVTPVFSGLFFKSHELNTHHNVFPIGWTVVLNTQDDDEPDAEQRAPESDGENDDDEEFPPRSRGRHFHSYTKPTLQNDNIFISSISNPSSSEFKPAASPTRQIAMMLWITLYWYFHQPAPVAFLTTKDSMNTPDAAKPRGEWRINVRRDGVLRGRNLIPKLERMGLIASLNSAVGQIIDDTGGAWTQMFVSRRMFWQIPAQLFLFTLQPNTHLSSFPGSPATSRPSSPHRQVLSQGLSAASRLDVDVPGTLVTAPSFPIGPFFSSSHLPTYYPPAPLVYTVTDNIRHPLRPKPHRMGEIFYDRFVPSVGQYLSFRVASLSPKPVPYLGPVGPNPPEQNHLTTLSDSSLLQMWLSKPRVTAFWGEYTSDMLTRATSMNHSFPAIGLWDGIPFGYFELYWVKEDILGRTLGNDASDWDRGVHFLVGEEWARGRVPVWLSSLAHWCFMSDYRTMNVCLEPRVDNARCIQQLEFCGFAKERQISFPHKQAWFARLKREAWEGPTL